MSDRARQRAGSLLVIIGAVLLLWAAAQWADGWWYQRNAARALEAQLAGQCEPLLSTPAELSTLEPGTAAETVISFEDARIEVPRLGMSAMIVEGDDAPSLRRGVCHIAGTADFATTGNVGLAAHRDSFFRSLREIAVGDTIQIATARDRHVYVVEWTRVVEPRAVDVLDPTPERALTLVTCHPFGYVGRAPNRFVVRARGVPSA